MSPRSPEVQLDSLSEGDQWGCWRGCGMRSHQCMYSL